MSTTTQPLKYLWTALFEDGTIIEQPTDDRYSKHDEESVWNPSAFRDVLDYQKTSSLLAFKLTHCNYMESSAIQLRDGVFRFSNHPQAYGIEMSLEDEPLIDRKLIFYREMTQDFNIDLAGGEPYVSRYILGYEGKDGEGKVQKKVIYING